MMTRARAACFLTTALCAMSVASVSLAQQPGATPPAQAAPAADAGPPPPGMDPQPKTPLPPRDTPRAPQPNSTTEIGGEGPKTPLPSRDTPRAPQPGQNGQKKAAQDPDWPCVQRKVSELSYGQMWAGPPLDQALEKWRDDDEVADLVRKLVARRTSMDDAKTAIGALAKKAGAIKNDKLTLLFAGVFDELNGERSQVIDGIERYARKQRALSEKIRTESIKMADVNKDMASQMSEEGQKAQQTLDWDTRIYDERTQQLTYVCETPVILEQRTFDLGREIQNLLNSG